MIGGEPKALDGVAPVGCGREDLLPGQREFDPRDGPFEIAVVSIGFSYWRTTTHMLGVPPKSSGGATNRCVMSRLTK